jgi:predicted nucleic acid-binding protein
MKTAVIDASVDAAALFPETRGKAARTLLTSGGALHAPDMIYVEVANVIWKRFRRGEIDGRDAADLLNDVTRLPLRVTPSAQLLAPALALAIVTDRTVYDCLYVALAVVVKSVMVSNDRRLVNALAGGPMKRHIAWLGQSH